MKMPIIKLACLAGAALGLGEAVAAQSFLFQAYSVPPGIISSHSNYYAAGALANTVNVPTTSSGYGFAYWTINGQRATAASGQSLTLAACTMSNDTVAIAWYLPLSQDTNGSGVADYLDLFYYGYAPIPTNSDTDGDGFTFLQELARGYDPVIPDLTSSGGAIIRLSVPAAYVPGTNENYYVIESQPQGILATTSGYVPTNTPVSTPAVPYGPSSGYYFGYWTVNGVRQTGVTGAGLTKATLPMTNDETAVAVFFLPGDTSPGLPDWYQWFWFGNTNQTPASDPTGDGIAIADDMARDYSPVIANVTVNGGGILRLSDAVTLIPTNTLYYYQITSQPQGILATTSGYVPTNMPVSTPAVPYGPSSGYYFWYWTVNGVRQTGVTGAALAEATLPMTNDETAVAVFFLPGDTSPGLPDWYQWFWFGNTNQTPASDPTGDGFLIADDMARDYSPVIANVTVNGGGILRLSDAVTLTNPPSPTGLVAIQQMPAYVSLGTNSINCQVSYPANRLLYTLSWQPTLPDNWRVVSVQGDGDPQWLSGQIVFLSETLPNPLNFSIWVTTATNQTGTNAVTASVAYWLDDMEDMAATNAWPNPLLVPSAIRHDADYELPYWVIDGLEVSRTLAYWRAGAYHIDPATPDGYSIGPGNTNGALYTADYESPFWQIDGSEVNRVLAYWRAGAYHPDVAGWDGYAPGPMVPTAVLPAPMAVVAFSSPNFSYTESAADLYTAGATVQITNSVVYNGTLLSLLWRPALPSGWRLASASAPGNPEVRAGEIVWTGALPGSPFQLVYTVQTVAGDHAAHQISATAEYQCSDTVNPAVASNNSTSALTLVTVKLNSVGVQNSRIFLNVAGESGQQYIIQRSTDLINWQNLSTVTAANGAASIQDVETSQQAFYRAVLRQ